MHIKEFERRMKISKSLKKYYTTDKGIEQRRKISMKQKERMKRLYENNDLNFGINEKN